MTKENSKIHYLHFLRKNELRVNRIYNYILWCCCLPGPLISIGVFFKAFPEITYTSCLLAFVITLVFAVIHTVLIRHKPKNIYTKYLGFVGCLIALYFMCISHMGIYLCYFFVPMTSLLYCNRRTFCIVSALSYITMVLCNWSISAYTAGLRVDIDQVPWFAGIIGGETIEFIMMFAAGFFIIKLMEEHLDSMYNGEIKIEASELSSYTDPLTGLWNRRYLEKAYDKYFVVQRNTGAILVIDLDNFKGVNDNFGHLEGDRALKLISEAMKKSFKSSSALTLCRFGGDEFLVLLPGVSSFADLSSKISVLISNTEEKLAGEPHFKDVTLSIGAAFMREDDADVLDVFARADQALLRVKRDGKNSFEVYSED
ncbi:MAG: GGDEF domain-containing protein [Fibrobacter sp.]|nr:GGDEF domain-containing protein [Fibrobacter sp.]